MDSNFDWVGFESSFGFYEVEIFMKYAGISFTYYVIILGVKSHDDLDDAGEGVQNWPKVDDVICTHSLKTNCQDYLKSHLSSQPTSE